MTKRRKIAESIIHCNGASGAVETWKKPIVNSIVIPSHARTSNSCSLQSGCYHYSLMFITRGPVELAHMNSRIGR